MKLTFEEYGQYLDCPSVEDLNEGIQAIHPGFKFKDEILCSEESLHDALASKPTIRASALTQEEIDSWKYLYNREKLCGGIRTNPLEQEEMDDWEYIYNHLKKTNLDGVRQKYKMEFYWDDPGDREDWNPYDEYLNNCNF